MKIQNFYFDNSNGNGKRKLKIPTLSWKNSCRLYKSCLNSSSYQSTIIPIAFLNQSFFTLFQGRIYKGWVGYLH